MNGLAKIVVIDDGERGAVDALSLELSELGCSSVTASLEAADEVLTCLRPPSAIVLRMPRARTTEYHAFLVLADKLRRREDMARTPVVLWDGDRAASEGGLSAILTRAGRGQPEASRLVS